MNEHIVHMNLILILKNVHFHGNFYSVFVVQLVIVFEFYLVHTKNNYLVISFDCICFLEELITDLKDFSNESIIFLRRQVLSFFFSRCYDYDCMMKLSYIQFGRRKKKFSYKLCNKKFSFQHLFMKWYTSRRVVSLLFQCMLISIFFTNVFSKEAKSNFLFSFCHSIYIYSLL